MAALTTSDLKIYLTGASSDGGAQTVPADSLGNFRSSTAFVNDSDLNILRSVTSAEADAGTSFYNALCVKNENGSGESALTIKFWINRETGSTINGSYAASGAVTCTLTDATNFDANGGYALNEDSLEVFYYSSKSGNDLTVPVAGRALRGTSISSGTNADSIVPFPWFDIATEVNPATPTSGAMQTIANITTAFTLDSDTTGSWTTPHYNDDDTGYANGIGINNNSFGDDLDDGNMCFVLIRYIVPQGAVRNPGFDFKAIKWAAEN